MLSSFSFSTGIETLRGRWCQAIAAVENSQCQYQGHTSSWLNQIVFCQLCLCQPFISFPHISLLSVFDQLCPRWPLVGSAYIRYSSFFSIGAYVSYSLVLLTSVNLSFTISIESSFSQFFHNKIYNPHAIQRFTRFSTSTLFV